MDKSVVIDADIAAGIDPDERGAIHLPADAKV
jgi:hypothetical protein